MELKGGKWDKRFSLCLKGNDKLKPFHVHISPTGMNACFHPAKSGIWYGFCWMGNWNHLAPPWKYNLHYCFRNNGWSSQIFKARRIAVHYALLFWVPVTSGKTHCSMAEHLLCSQVLSMASLLPYLKWKTHVWITGVCDAAAWDLGVRLSAFEINITSSY